MRSPWGWSVSADRVFRDDGHSGASLRRPGLDRLRDAAAAARLDCILITEPDRLARNYVYQVLLVEELQKHGAEVEFLDRPMGRDPHDQLLLQIRRAVAEPWQSMNAPRRFPLRGNAEIAERMRRGRLRKLRAGTLLPWTQPPHGYRLDPGVCEANHPIGCATRPECVSTRPRRRWCATCSPGSPTRAPRSMDCASASISSASSRPGDTEPVTARPCTAR